MKFTVTALPNRVLKTGSAYLALLGLAASLPLVAQAQEEEMAADATEEIIVTGTRIVNANLVSSSPVTVIAAEELAFQGTVRIEDMLRTLPQIYSGQSSGQSNGATGTATVALRNLGAGRTLVLLNSRRMPSGSPIQGGLATDINQIPGALVDRIEILTGGASAIYGSDAVSGVVNFLLKKDFQGVEFGYQTSLYQHDNGSASSGFNQQVTAGGFAAPTGDAEDGKINTLSLIIGGDIDNGRGNITAYATYWDVEEVIEGNRSYSACALAHPGLPDNRGTDLSRFVCGGSGTIPEGRFSDFEVGGTDLYLDPATGNFLPYDGRQFNYGASNFFQRPDERVTLGAFAHYDITDQVEVYAEIMFTDDRSLSQIAPSGAFFVTDELSCGNPLLSEQQFEATCGAQGLTRDDVLTDFFIGRRNVEGGNRMQDLRHTTYRGVFGIEVDITEDWALDVSYQKSEVSFESTYLNDLSTTRIIRALDAVENDDGDIVCQSVVDGSDPACVPWNIFTPGAVTQAQIDYITLPLFSRGTTEQDVFSVIVSGNLGAYGVKLPTATRGVQVVFGYEQREEQFSFNPDQGFQTGDGAGQGGATPPVSGGFKVKEFFVEAHVPIIEGRPGIEELSLDLSYRNSDYDYGIKTDTYGIRAGWAISKDVKIRGGIQRAVRGANLRELFQPQGFNLDDLGDGDPCAGPVTDGKTDGGDRTLEECMRSGVTADRFGSIAASPAGQYNYLQGGNPDLKPEEADTFTFGVVITPFAVNSLTISIDYFKMKIVDGINNLTPTFILNQCLDGNLALCNLVNRREGLQDLWIGSDVSASGHIVALTDNLAVEEVEGFDIIASYDLNLGGMGTLRFNTIASLFTKWDQQELAGAPVVDCKGKWGGSCGIPTPEFQNHLRVTWDAPKNLSVSVAWRHYGEVQSASTTTKDIEAFNYIDLAANWEVREGISLRAGMSNLFDKEPPILGEGAGSSIDGNGNTFPSAYDALGRYLYFGITLRAN